MGAAVLKRTDIAMKRIPDRGPDYEVRHAINWRIDFFDSMRAWTRFGVTDQGQPLRLAPESTLHVALNEELLR